MIKGVTASIVDKFIRHEANRTNACDAHNGHRNELPEAQGQVTIHIVHTEPAKNNHRHSQKFNDIPQL